MEASLARVGVAKLLSFYEFIETVVIGAAKLLKEVFVVV